MKCFRLLLAIGLPVLMVFALPGGAHGSSTALNPPVLISPADTATIVTPTFTWQVVEGAYKYQIQVATSNAFTTLLFDTDTDDLTITPVNTLPNDVMYWHVRAKDALNNPGPWSSTWSFTKTIPAPILSLPVNGSTIVTPVFSWNASEGAYCYQVQIATGDSFIGNIVSDETTCDRAFSPVDTLSNGTLYWRVRGLDPDNHTGSFSAIWSFTKQIPAPALDSPGDTSTISFPSFSWNPAQGAACYTIQVADNNTFTGGILVDEQTCDLEFTPTATVQNGTLYWRVWGQDPDDHDGIKSAVRSFTKSIVAPTLVSPANAANITLPTLQWNAGEGAVNYHVQVATDAAFTVGLKEYDTFNLYLTPIASLSNTTYYWHVRGEDQDGHAGSYFTARTFILSAPPTCVNPGVTLAAPADAAVTTTDPNFSWNCMAGATKYRLKLYKPDEGTPYDDIDTVYTAYTPYAAPNAEKTLINGGYMWKVEAYSGTTLIGTSAARSFTKNATFNLVTPANGSNQTYDPSLEWQPLQGAVRYVVELYKDASLYDSINTDYPFYTPYNAPNAEQTLINGTYNWQVKAYRSTSTSDGNLIATSSQNWTFTKAAVMNLTKPTDTSSSIDDPTLEWDAVPGFHLYQVEIYKGGVLYDTIHTQYPTYTPFAAPNAEQTLINGSYDWLVEAYKSFTISPGQMIVASAQTWSFTKAAVMNLLSPGNGVTYYSDPTFQWESVRGAKRYLLKIYQGAVLFDTVTTEYPIYTPYAAPNAEATIPIGDYSWYVEAYRSTTYSAGELITTSVQTWNFSISGKRIYLPIVRK